MAYPELKRAVRAQAEAHKATVVLIEDRASGTQLIQELIAEGVHAITRYSPEGDKQMRLYAQTATIENGFVYLPREAPWLADYLHELTTFPNSKYDDQVDSTSQALDWIKRAARSSNVLNYNWRELALERHHAGHTVAAIAAEFRLPMERSKGGSMKSGKRRRKRASPCWRCGSAPTWSSAPGAARRSDTTFRSAGGEVANYHPECYTKMLSQ